MPADVVGMEVTTAGNFAVTGTARYASNRVLVAASANPHNLYTQPGSLFTSLIIRSSQNTSIHSVATVLNSMAWNLHHPSWEGFIPLTDDMIIICSAASIVAQTVRFNLVFVPLPEYIKDE